jgi:hypothetical protein
MPDNNKGLGWATLKQKQSEYDKKNKKKPVDKTRTSAVYSPVQKKGTKPGEEKPSRTRTVRVTGERGLLGKRVKDITVTNKEGKVVKQKTKDNLAKRVGDRRDAKKLKKAGKWFAKEAGRNADKLLGMRMKMSDARKPKKRRRVK